MRALQLVHCYFVGSAALHEFLLVVLLSLRLDSGLQRCLVVKHVLFLISCRAHAKLFPFSVLSIRGVSWFLYSYCWPFWRGSTCMHLMSACLLLLPGSSGLDNLWGRHHAFGQKLISLLGGVGRGCDGTSALRLLRRFAYSEHVLGLLDRLGQRADSSLMRDQNRVVFVLGYVDIGVLLALIDICEVLGAFIVACRVLLRRVHDLACLNRILLLFRRLVNN